MTIRLATQTRNDLATEFKDAFDGGVIRIFTGPQPIGADSAETGTLLGIVTKASGAHTAEVSAVGSLTIAGTSGSVDTVTVNAIDILGGSVASTGAVNTTADAVAAKINTNPKNHLFTASTTGASGVITLTAVKGLGTLPNTWAVSGTYTTITGGTYVAMTGGVDQVNGLVFGTPANGTVPKHATDVWSFLGLAQGTAGWFRLAGGVADGGGASSVLPRLDGSIGTANADLNLSNIAIDVNTPVTIDTFSFTVPAA